MSGSGGGSCTCAHLLRVLTPSPTCLPAVVRAHGKHPWLLFLASEAVFLACAGGCDCCSQEQHLSTKAEWSRFWRLARHEPTLWRGHQYEPELAAAPDWLWGEAVPRMASVSGRLVLQEASSALWLLGMYGTLQHPDSYTLPA